MPLYRYNPSGVCCQEIQFEIDEEKKIKQVFFIGGCPGNLSAISKLIQGKPAAEVAELLSGNDCAGKGTSCADQLAQALQQALCQL
ncbi:MAG: TIGR03905 family TSCPD domain-containing protein [Elusimicrobiaceae bacterium]|nr:TIGR03905 family TSCPD domain-containing protein [Elusimicrobiaceae bacterium]